MDIFGDSAAEEAEVISLPEDEFRRWLLENRGECALRDYVDSVEAYKLIEEGQFESRGNSSRVYFLN